MFASSAKALTDLANAFGYDLVYWSDHDLFFVAAEAKLTDVRTNTVSLVLCVRRYWILFVRLAFLMICFGYYEGIIVSETV